MVPRRLGHRLEGICAGTIPLPRRRHFNLARNIQGGNSVEGIQLRGWDSPLYSDQAKDIIVLGLRIENGNLG